MKNADNYQMSARIMVETSTGDTFVIIVPQHGVPCHQLSELEAVIRSARTPGWIEVRRLVPGVLGASGAAAEDLWVDYLLNLAHVVTFREPV